MQSFRNFVAIGVGAAIALSLIEPGVANASSLPKNDTDSCLEDARLNNLTETPTSAIWSKVDCSLTNHQPLAKNTAESQNSLFFLQSGRENEEWGKAIGYSQAFSSNLFKTDLTQKPEESPKAQENPPAKPSVEPARTSSQTSEKPQTTFQSIPKPFRPNRSTVNAQALKPVQNNLNQPIQPTNNPKLAQSAPPAKTPPASVPEYLNPSANPLLFPTRSEEVQIRRSEVITLDQAIELGRRNNRDLQGARLTLERTQAALQEALASEFPSAGLVLDFTRSESASARISNAGNTDPTLAPFLNRNPVSTTFSSALQLSYDFYTSGIRPATIRAAGQQVRFQELEIERLSEQVRLNVTRAYYNLQQADAQVRISEASVANAAQILRDTQLQEQAGLGTRFDVLQTQVTLANASQDLTRDRSLQRISRRQIVQLLSLAQNVDVSAVETITEAGTWELSLEQTIVLALKNRAELEQQLVQRDVSEQRRRIALGANRPQASLTATYNILGVLNDGSGPAQGLSLGARLQWNFFDGGAARARARQETVNIALAENTFATQRNQIRFDVEQAFSNLNASRENIQTASFALQAAEESLRLARLRFGAGVGTNTDVINQLTALTRSQVNRLQAVLDYNRALADLQRAVSNLPDSNLFDLP